jgi:hypothetical protein
LAVGTAGCRISFALVLLFLAQAPRANATPTDTILADPSHATASDGQRALDLGRTGEALRIWTDLADRGDAEAEFDLGLLYDLGRGVPADPLRAFGWYKRSADAGFAPGEFNVGVMLDSGQIGPRDAKAAALWYARAAARGQARAAFDLGLLYAEGDGVPRNVEAAVAWFRLAAPALPAAAEKLGRLKPSAASPGAAPVALTPALDLSPADGATLTLAKNTVAVELVWTAPPQSIPVRYYVEVVEVEGDSMFEVFATFTDCPAILATLPRRSGGYAWRVYTVGLTSPHYAVTEWARVEVNAGR